MGIVSKLGAERYQDLKDLLRHKLPLTKAQIRKFKGSLIRAHCKYFENYIFIHINKAGGTSIERALGMPFLTHDTLQERIDYLGRRRAEQRFKFAFVRHPLSRIVSIYHYRHRKLRTLDLKQDRERFQAWVWDQVIEPGASSRMVMPQVNWITYNGVVAVDFIGHFERIEQDYASVRAQVENAGPLPKLNFSRVQTTPNYHWWCTPEISRRLAAIYAEDFDLFDYSR